MSRNQVTLTFPEPDAPAAPPPPAPAKPADPNALTREERSNLGWHVWAIVWTIGLPSIGAMAFVGCAGLYYSAITAPDVRSWAAMSAGILIVTLFLGSLPIGAALNRDNAPVAKAALGFWVCCIIFMLAVMGHFALHKPSTPQPQPIVARDMPGRNARELDREITWRREALADAAEHRAKWDEHARVWYASTQTELRKLETWRYGRPVTGVPAPEPGHRGGIDLAAVSILMLIGASIGLAISAGALAAVLTERATAARQAAAAADVPAPLPATDAYHPDESADGFQVWALQSVAKIHGGKVRTAEAFSHYLSFCSRNAFPAPLGVQEFGRRLRAWLADVYGIDGRHSNGTLYDGVTLAGAGRPLATNGAAA
jgi:hypothetical protein